MKNDFVEIERVDKFTYILRFFGNFSFHVKKLLGKIEKHTSNNVPITSNSLQKTQWYTQKSEHCTKMGRAINEIRYVVNLYTSY